MEKKDRDNRKKKNERKRKELRLLFLQWIVSNFYTVAAFRLSHGRYEYDSSIFFLFFFAFFSPLSLRQKGNTTLVVLKINKYRNLDAKGSERERRG